MARQTKTTPAPPEPAKIEVTVTTTVTTHKRFNTELENEQLILVLQDAGIIPKELDPAKIRVDAHCHGYEGEDMFGVGFSWEETTTETK